MNRICYLLFALLTAAAPLHAQTRWTLAWNDDFDGPANSAPDQSKWAYDLGAGGWGNHELETYTDNRENSFLDGKGNLVIRTLRSTSGGYTSARLKTQGKFSTAYGKIEVRIKLPYGQGIWPAFWMLGDDIESVAWPTCGEIDIMENIGREPLLNHGSLHGPGYPPEGITGKYELPDHQPYHDAFHVFTIEWTPGKVEFFVDGVRYESVTPASMPAKAKWVFEHPFFILLNVAVGGDWPGNPDSSTVFPQEMLVDYVRVWKPVKSD
jgi:beta-glucanase (GH16 family)